MSDIAAAEELFFTRTGLDQARVDRVVGEALNGADDGELFRGIRPVGELRLR